MRRTFKKANGVRVPRAMYSLARSDGDYIRVKEFLRDTEFNNERLVFPTLMAYRKGKLVGVLGTYPSDKAVIAGPMYVDAKGPVKAFVALRLAEAYEAVLRELGIQAYVFSIKRNEKKQIGMMRRMGFNPYAKQPSRLWYLRRL